MQFDYDTLSALTKKIYISLLDKRYFCDDDDTFYKNYPSLFNTANKKRKPQYKRKRILIFVDQLTPKNKKDLEEALSLLKEKYKNINLQLSSASFAFLSSKSKEIEALDLKCNPDYSDIIAFIKGSEKNYLVLADLLDAIRKEKHRPFHLFPNLVLRYDKKPTLDNLINAIEGSLYFARLVNKDEKAKLWNEYAFDDNLYKQVRSVLDKANRRGDIKEYLRKFNYIVDDKDKMVVNPYQRILVLGNSTLSVADLTNAIRETGMNPDNFDFELDYKGSDYDFENLRYTTKYSELLLGPTPHRVKGIRGYSSAVSLIQNNVTKYPHLVCLSANGILKITKDSFERGLKETLLYKSTQMKNSKVASSILK